MSRYAIARPANNARQNGVLPIQPSTPKGNAVNMATSHSKAAAPRLKVVIRRLAPGLTEAKFAEAIGEEWRLGGERVDWASYKAGKVSKE